MLPNIQVLVDDVMYVSHDGIPISTEGVLFISRSVPGVWAYLTVWSTSRIISLPAVKLICKVIEPRTTAVVHLGKYNQQNSPGEFKNPARPVFCSCCVQWNLVTNDEFTPKL